MCTRGRWWRPYRHTVSCRNERSSVETGLGSQRRIDLERERESWALPGLHDCRCGTSQACFPLHCACYRHTIWYTGLWEFTGAARAQIRNICSCSFGVHCPCSLPLGTTDLSVPLSGTFPEGPGNGVTQPVSSCVWLLPRPHGLCLQDSRPLVAGEQPWTMWRRVGVAVLHKTVSVGTGRFVSGNFPVS